MALRVPLFSPKIFPKPIKSRNCFFPTGTPLKNRRKSNLSCTNDLNDAELAVNLAAEMAKINTLLVQRKEAMKKSIEVLFKEFCQYVGLKEEEVKQRWRKMDEEEKMGWAKGFVSEWGEAFHPLSSRSVKEMVEEHLIKEDPSPVSSPSLMFPSLKRIIRFSQDEQR